MLMEGTLSSSGKRLRVKMTVAALPVELLTAISEPLVRS